MSNNKSTASTLKKKTKTKGPIRIEAVVPIIIICVGVWSYTVLFLDSHLRRGLEFVSSKIYGAEINIHSLKIKFGDPSVTIHGIEVTDKDTPTNNIIAIEQAKFALAWDALLRAKILIEESSLNGLAIRSPRKTPGEVYPPPPPEPSAGPSITDKVGGMLKDELTNQLQNNVLGDLANILGGSDPADAIKNLKDSLSSEVQIRTLQSSLTAKKDEWAKRVEKLPKPDELKALINKVKSTQINTKDLNVAKRQLDDLRKDAAQVEGILKQYQTGQKEVQNDIQAFQAGLKDLETSIRKDIESLEGQLKLPEIDANALSQSLLTKIMGDKLTPALRLIDQVKKYVPEKKSAAAKDQKEFIPHARGNGRTYKFPVTVGYPMFWLRKAELSSRSTPEGFSGDFTGQLINLTSDPQVINQPTSINISGSAPRQELNDLDFKLVMDYRGSESENTMNLRIGSHAMPEQTFAQSGDVTFGLKQSRPALTAHAALKGGQISAQIKEIIQHPEFLTEAKSPILKEALTSVTGRIKTLQMTIGLQGSLTDPKLELDSNLGTELAKGFESHLKVKIDEARSKIKTFVDGRIGAEKNKLTADVNKVQSAFSELLKGKDSEFRSLQAELTKVQKDKEASATGNVKEDLKNKAKDALKKLKI